MWQAPAVSCAVSLVLASGSALAGVVTDGSVGPASSLTGPNYSIPATLGKTIGSNLFHSFSAFSLVTNESATFSGPGSGITNVIGRVTGGSISSIDGQIASTIPGASLYLLNPSGIMFGQHASLAVPGAFYASTASYLRLADGSRFYADLGNTSSLTAAPPAAFGFLNSSPAPIAVNGTTLAVSNGATLGLVGGDVAIGASGTPAALNAASGDVRIASTRSAGEIGLTPTGLDTSSLAALGTVSLSGGSTLNVSEAAGARGGRIFIRAGQLTLTNSNIEANSIAGNGKGVDIAVSGSAAVSGGEVRTVTTGAGNAGPISISAGSITISNGALIDTSCDPGCTTGSGGPLALSAQDALVLAGTPAGAIPTGVVSNSFGAGASGHLVLSGNSITLSDNVLVQSQAGAAGSGGIAVNSGSLTVLNGAQIDSSTATSGAGGALTINSSGPAIISGSIPSQPSGLFSNSLKSGNAGTIQIVAGSLSVLSGGQISSSAQLGSSGAGGMINIGTQGGVLIQGKDVGGSNSAIVTNTFSSGNAGTIQIAAGTMSVSDSGRVQSQSQGAGRSGDIAIQSGSLVLASNGQISVDVRSSGGGGTIRVDAGTVDISGLNTGIFGKTYAGATGAGGNILLNVGSVALHDQGGVFAGTDGVAQGGAISIVAADLVTLDGGASVSSQSNGLGFAGNILIDTGTLTLAGHSAITSQALLADGGNVIVRARDLVYLNHSSITTMVGTGFGSGGNITIDPTFVVLQGGSIIADALGGNGGNITIDTQFFFRDPASIVSASSQLGISGSIIITAPTLDLSGSLLALASGLLDLGALQTGRCAARAAGQASTFVVRGRGGLPPRPDGYLLASAGDKYSSDQPFRSLGASARQSLALWQPQKQCID